MAAVRTEQAGSATFTLYHGCCEDGTSRQRDIHAESWLLWGRTKHAARHSRFDMPAVMTEQAGSATFTLYHGCCGDGTSRQRDIHAVSWLLWGRNKQAARHSRCIMAAVGRNKQAARHSRCIMAAVGRNKQAARHSRCIMAAVGRNKQAARHSRCIIAAVGRNKQAARHSRCIMAAVGRNKQAARHSRCIMAAVRTEQAGSATFTLYHGCCGDGTSRQRDIHAVSWLLWGRNKQAARHSRCIMAAVRTEQAGSATFTLYHGCCEDGTSRQRDIHAVSWLLWDGTSRQRDIHAVSWLL
ncbi:hypothetical protein RRG08_030938 [Elysia crispata]|uniref:Uncharacterized protein n=1 Tax=Elysia crispata TaxID=231223 RepID=A0AAE1AAT5_9GAST|nr:hypothetical protein RRG08_030938 [Elysia crispata]